MSDKYFTSPEGKINYCNECKKPIKKTEGRYCVEIKEDVYLVNGDRLLNYYGSQTYCDSCFERLFKQFDFKNVEPIFKKETI